MALTEEQTTAAILIVVGIIIIEGIWLSYLTYMMWRRSRRDQLVKKDAVKGTGEEMAEAPSEVPGKNAPKEEMKRIPPK